MAKLQTSSNLSPQRLVTTPSSSLSPEYVGFREVTSSSSQGLPSLRRSQGSDGRPHWRLEHVSELRVLEAGLTQLQDLLTRNVLTGPWAEATSQEAQKAPVRRLLRASFFERAFEGNLELKACPPGDVLAAQGDLRQLTVEQLLMLRLRFLDFPISKAGSFDVHSNFLSAVDSELFGKIGGRSFKRPEVSPEDPPDEHLAALKALGLRIVLNLGAAALMVEGCTEDGHYHRRSAIPSIWLTGLHDPGWPNCSYMVANIDELWVQPLNGQNPDLSRIVGHTEIAVVLELQSGAGQDRLLHWEITTLDTASDDVPATLTLVRHSRRRTSVQHIFDGKKKMMQKSNAGTDVASPLTVSTDEASDVQSPSLATSSEFPLSPEVTKHLPKLRAASLPITAEGPVPQSKTADPHPAYQKGLPEPTPSEESSYFGKFFANFICCAVSTRKMELQDLNICSTRSRKAEPHIVYQQSD
eukprot:TRINITY_DN66306_c0_g1_i1.p1 TRINITY_DN66306_c0_g1~~TRINITY_DN66306_c0_g1_i1.p1  ORF type:complete len:484 (-),score=72.60 TRINITY_DN66306_c0_g1_i1:250-1656(-)